MSNELIEKARDIIEAHKTTDDWLTYEGAADAVIAGMRWAADVCAREAWGTVYADRIRTRFAAQDEQPGPAEAGGTASPKTSPPPAYRVLRDEHGHPEAIDRRVADGTWFTALELVVGSERNELNAESVCEMLNMKQPGASDPSGPAVDPVAGRLTAPPAASAQGDEFDRFAYDVLDDGDTTSAAYVAKCARSRFGRLAEERDEYKRAAAQALDEAAQARKECGGWEHLAGTLQDDLAKARSGVRRLSAERTGEVWLWQGEGGNNVESLACPVLIEAEQLRRELARAASDAYADAARLARERAARFTTRGTHTSELTQLADELTALAQRGGRKEQPAHSGRCRLDDQGPVYATLKAATGGPPVGQESARPGDAAAEPGHFQPPSDAGRKDEKPGADVTAPSEPGQAKRTEGAAPAPGTPPASLAPRASAWTREELVDKAKRYLSAHNAGRKSGHTPALSVEALLVEFGASLSLAPPVREKGAEMLCEAHGNVSATCCLVCLMMERDTYRKALVRIGDGAVGPEGVAQCALANPLGAAARGEKENQ